MNDTTTTSEVNRFRKRAAELEASLRRIWDIANHAPVATKAEQTIADIMREVGYHVALSPEVRRGVAPALTPPK